MGRSLHIQRGARGLRFLPSRYHSSSLLLGCALQAKADYAALCHAAEKGSLSMVQLLLAKGANPYTYDDTGYCAYDYLVDQAKPLELLAALLKTDTAFAQTQRSYQQVHACRALVLVVKAWAASRGLVCTPSLTA
jgi:hypothetical protein